MRGVAGDSVAIAGMQYHIYFFMSFNYKPIFPGYDITTLFVRVSMKGCKISFHIVHLSHHGFLTHSK